MTLESLQSKCVMPFRADAFLGDLGGEVSSQLSLMRSSYYLSTVVPDSIIITYGGDSCLYDDMESLYEFYVGGYVTHFRIGDTGMGIFLMLPRAGILSCLMDTRVPGGKGS